VSSALGRVLVVGTGLVGTSVGLALRDRGVEVRLADLDPQALAVAAGLGAGVPARPGDEPASLAVVAVPPAVTGQVAVDLLTSGRARFVTDVASVKTAPAAVVAQAGAETAARYVGGHPMAGREVAGPRGARSDLFEGRPWVLCPSGSDPAAVDQATTLAILVGAMPLVMSPADHDAAVALVSHTPHVMSALVAARLVGAPDHEVRLAGPGIGDVTRIAAGDPALWTEILTANAAAVRDLLVRVRSDLDAAVAALDDAALGSTEALTDLLRVGVAGRGRLPGKHGAGHEDFVAVPVRLEDRPGQLARLFADIDAAGVNVEDLHIDHVPGRAVGVVAVSVRPEAEAPLLAALQARGWRVDD
jgi:prephenate dehydrogenase